MVWPHAKYEVLMRSSCPTHSTNECVACGGTGYIHQWVAAVWKALPVQAPGRISARVMAKDFLMLGDPKELEALDLLAGTYAQP